LRTTGFIGWQISETTELGLHEESADADSGATRVVSPRPLTEPYEIAVNLSDYWNILAHHRWLVAAITIAVLAAATAAAFLIPPVYRAEIVFVPVEEEDPGSALSALASQLGSLAMVAGLEGGGGPHKDKAIATLLSRTFTKLFIEDQQLMPILFADEWDSPNQTWFPDDPLDIPSQWDAYELFETDIRFISEDPLTGIITLRIEWTDPNLAALWANDLMQQLNEHMRQAAVDEATKSIEYLKTELEKTSVVEIQQSIYRLIETQINNVMLANVNEQYAFKIIDPAIVPDADKFVWPNRPLFIGGGLVVGIFLGMLAAFTANFFGSVRAPSSP
jgi:capsular polysaccharide biosynthesis protein